jgi:NADPH:quinone reductase-like Zn-dependent oxidoreductase
MRRSCLLLLSAALLLLLLPAAAAADPSAAATNESAAAFFAARDPCAGLHAAGAVRPPAVKKELVLVTGGSGFIGSTLVDRLLSLG